LRHPRAPAINAADSPAQPIRGRSELETGGGPPEDGIDNDLDGLTDMADPSCGNPWSDNEIAASSACGLLGVEVLPVLGWAAARRRRRLP